MLGGKGGFETHADNLMLVAGKVSLEGMAIKVFGLNEGGGADDDVGFGGDRGEQPVFRDQSDPFDRFGLDAGVGGNPGFRRRNELDGLRSGFRVLLLPHRSRAQIGGWRNEPFFP